jgi:hypothetical protein
MLSVRCRIQAENENIYSDESDTTQPPIPGYPVKDEYRILDPEMATTERQLICSERPRPSGF